MMEQTHAREGHSDAILVARVDDMVVANATTSLSYILHATLMSTLDIVAEGEEGIAAEADACVLSHPSGLLLACERLGALGKELLPCAFGKHVIVIVGDIDIDGVVAVGTPNARHERQAHHLRMLAQPPDVGLLSGETRAMDTTLLTCSDADCLPVLDVAD